MEIQRITVWVTGPIKSTLDAYHDNCAKAEAEFIRSKISGGAEKRAARAEAARLRPERWPTQDVLATAAVRRYLREPHLAGPWEPLSPRELGRMRLAGRWPGPKLGGLVAERQFGLPADVVLQVRTASWRISKEWLDLLEEEGLVGVKLDAEDRARRDELASNLLTPGQIIRDALGQPFALRWPGLHGSTK
ncbi:hypothetical protein [Streptacidiphilus sp. MAP5-52]|uniref:hypothetical protein n=1 Tax=Streptacidiphilus sp. MAP5-52 TaxID=3156267 RepID=UPI003516AC79